MARDLALKTNVIPPDVPFPFGRIKNNPGDGTGTPVNELLYGDFHQFFAKMFSNSGLTYNNLPDNVTNTFQFYEALRENINKYKNYNLYITNTILTTADIGSLVAFLGFPGAATFTLPTADAAAVYKRIKIFNIGTAGLNVISGGIDTLNPSPLPTLYQYDLIELFCNGVGSWVIERIQRYKNDNCIHTILPIGDWNMNTTQTKTVAHGLTLSKIRSIQSSIIIDTSNAIYPLGGFINLTPTGSAYADASNINLFRFSNADAAYTGSLSAFQNASFQATSFNRGWITIEHTP